MTDRTNIPVSDALYKHLQKHKGESDTWEDALERAVDALEDADPDAVGREQTACIPAEQVDEIARKAAAEVENRMTRR